MGTPQPNAFNKFSLMMKAFSCSLLKIVATNRRILETVTVAEGTMFLEHIYQLLCSVSLQKYTFIIKTFILNSGESETFEHVQQAC